MKKAFYCVLCFLLIFSCKNVETKPDEKTGDNTEKFTVTYKVYGSDGWIDMSSEQVEKGGNFDDAKTPDNAKIDYSGRKYSFVGWTTNDLSSANPSTATGQSYSGAVVADMTVYAVYQVHPQVTYKYWDGTEWAQLGEIQTVEPNSSFDDSKKPVFVVKCNMRSSVAGHETESYDYAFQFNNTWTNTGWTSAVEATKTANDTVSATALSASDKVTGDMTVYAMYKPIKDFVYVEKGKSPTKGEASRTESDYLTMDYDFLICDHEVTQKEYKAYTDAISTTHTSAFTGENLPVEKVDWYDAVEYCNWLSKQEGLELYYSIDKTKEDPNNKNSNTTDTKKWLVTINENANGYRLPLELEWEYAARGGVNGEGYTYSGSNTFDGVAWFVSNSNSKTHDVRSKTANELGLYDMSGNVWEWCWDWKGSTMTLGGADLGDSRIMRGGSWNDFANYCEVSARKNIGPYNSNSSLIGFRVVRSCR